MPRAGGLSVNAALQLCPAGAARLGLGLGVRQCRGLQLCQVCLRLGHPQGCGEGPKTSSEKKNHTQPYNPHPFNLIKKGQRENWAMEIDTTKAKSS